MTANAGLLHDAPTSAPIRVVVAAGQTVVCEALASRLDCETDLVAMSVPDARRRPDRWRDTLAVLAPNVVIVDFGSTKDAAEDLIDEIQSAPGDPSVVALVTEDDARFVAALVSAGVAASVVKSAPVNELLTATRSVAHGDSWISPSLLRDVLGFLHGGPGSHTDHRLAVIFHEAP